MSRATDQFEQNLSTAIQKIFEKDTNFENVPQWFENMYGKPPYRLEETMVIGGQLGKTDILVNAINSYNQKISLKISVKMANADYWGNWYSHNRFIDEFGMESFEKIVLATTDWANNWVNFPQAKLFVGVSISFGTRTGNTAGILKDILTDEDILSIIRGNFEDETRNADLMYVSSIIPSSWDDLFEFLKPITLEEIRNSDLINNMKIIYRPINPMTERSNRGKCSYTMFVPFAKATEPIIVNNLDDLMKLGRYEPVECNSINHNRIINMLKNEYNIYVEVKN